MISVAIVVGWIACGLLAYGLCLGDFSKYEQNQHEVAAMTWNPEFQEAMKGAFGPPYALAVMACAMGPMGLIGGLLTSDRPYKLRWKGW